MARSMDRVLQVISLIAHNVNLQVIVLYTPALGRPLPKFYFDDVTTVFAVHLPIIVCRS